MKNVLSEVFRCLYEAKCPGCGTDNAYVGLSSIECPNKSCSHYDEEQANRALKSFQIDNSDIEVIRAITKHAKVPKEVEHSFESAMDKVLAEYSKGSPVNTLKLTVDEIESLCVIIDAGLNGGIGQFYDWDEKPDHELYNKLAKEAKVVLDELEKLLPEE